GQPADQLTTDHVAGGDLTAFLGGHPRLRPTVGKPVPVRVPSTLVLATDGAYTHFPPLDELAALGRMGEHTNAAISVNRLAQAVRHARAIDDFTVAVLPVTGPAAPGGGAGGPLGYVSEPEAE